MKRKKLNKTKPKSTNIPPQPILIEANNTNKINLKNEVVTRSDGNSTTMSPNDDLNSKNQDQNDTEIKSSSSMSAYMESFKKAYQNQKNNISPGIIQKKETEIKVALIGNVSAGKTTVLDALLQNRYGEVAKKRTTAGAHYFVLNDARGKIPQEIQDGKCLPKNSFNTIHEEIKEDNQRRISNGNEISKKVFQVEILEPLVRCRDDVTIVLVDIPGINEAGTDNKYKDFLSLHWTTFDCVIVVMDGKQVVNTDDQVNLLNFVKENNQVKKTIPIIILCNKIDDPLEEEQAELVNEAQLEVQTIFNVEFRDKSFQLLLASDCNTIQYNDDIMSPAFIPVS